jgi:hypothetical protein
MQKIAPATWATTGFVFLESLLIILALTNRMVVTANAWMFYAVAFLYVVVMTFIIGSKFRTRRSKRR